MSYSMKVSILALAVFAIAVSSGWCKGTADVTNSIHNLSVTSYDPDTGAGSSYETDSQEVCVFCHTPHGGELNTPLWNKDISTLQTASYFTHYSNALLSSAMQGLATDRAVNMESLLCLSCHDGSLSINAVHNVSNAHTGADYRTGGVQPYMEIVDLGAGVVDARTGDGSGDLSDDHPISFSYDAVFADPIYSGGARNGELRSVALATTWAGEGVRFFAPGNRVECSTCHDPHVFYDYFIAPDYAPFLIMPNTNSNLCFACHNK